MAHSPGLLDQKRRRKDGLGYWVGSEATIFAREHPLQGLHIRIRAECGQEGHFRS